MVGNFFADGNAGDAELVAASVVALDENADGVAAFFASSTREEVPMPPLNSLQIMPVPPPTLPSSTGPAVGSVEGVEGVFGLHVESVDVVEPAVPGFGDDGERPP